MPKRTFHLRLRSAAIIFVLGALAGIAIDWLRPKANRYRHLPLEALAELALDKRLAQVSLDRVPLDRAVADVSQLADVPIVLDLETLKASNLSATWPVTVKLRNASLAQVMDELTHDVGTPTAKLTWFCDGQHITVTTGDRQPPTVTRVYDVSDLLDGVLPTFDDGPYFGLTQVAKPVLTPPPPTAPPPVAKACRSSASEDLERLILDTVAPESWREAGGALGSLRVIGRLLVVTTTAQVHHDLRKLLDDLRTRVAPEAAALPPEKANTVQRWQADAAAWLPVADTAVEAALVKTIFEFKVDRQPLPQAITALGKAIGVHIRLDPSLADFVIKKTEISLGLRDADGYAALEKLLAAAHESALQIAPPDMPGQLVDLTWTIDDGVIVIVNWSSTSKQVVLSRMYDVREWFMDGSNNVPSPSREQHSDDLIKLIRDAVTPDSWRENGGAFGSIKESRGFLIVTQSYPNHETVRRMLGTLRRLGKTAATRPATQSRGVP